MASFAIGLDKPAVERLLANVFEGFFTRLATWRNTGDDELDDAPPTTDEDDPA